jgi:hypothetical protein
VGSGVGVGIGVFVGGGPCVFVGPAVGRGRETGRGTGSPWQAVMTRLSQSQASFFVEIIQALIMDEIGRVNASI